MSQDRAAGTGAQGELVPHRIVHFDLKGLTPRAEYAGKLLEDLRDFGCNGLLLEFENKFPFEACPEIVHPCAYGKAELAGFAEHGLAVIPLLQCTGHLDYLLAHEKYAPLRHNGSTYQWDWRKPETFRLWTQMADEILEVFPRAEYFHIGADEVVLRDEEEFSGYLEQVERCVDYLRARGLKVLVWDDVFRTRTSPALNRLLGKVVVCVWQYRAIDETLIANMQERGATVWGASRIYANEQYRGLGPLRGQFRNIDDWLALTRKYALQGHIGTLWGRAQCHTPLHAALPEAMYMAAYLARGLCGKCGDRAEFDREFAAGYFGTSALQLTELTDSFGNDPEYAERLFLPVDRNGDIMEIWRLLNKLDCLLAYCDQCFAVDGALLPAYRRGMVPPKITANYLDGVRIAAERAAVLRREFATCFRRYFCDGQIDEYLESRFAALLERNERWGGEIAAAARNYHPQLPVG